MPLQFNKIHKFAHLVSEMMAMETSSAPVEGEATSKALKCETWVLKVPIHCEGCKKKVKKVLQGIEGVYTISIDTEQQKVAVTGNIRVETLIKKLMKTGKHAETFEDKEPAKPRPKAASPVNRSGTTPTKLGEKAKDGGKLPDKHPAAREASCRRSKKGGESEICIGGATSDPEGQKKKKNKGSVSTSATPGSSSSCLSKGVGLVDKAVGLLSDPKLACQYQLMSPQSFYFSSDVGASSSPSSSYNSVAPFYHVQAQPSFYNHGSPPQTTPLDSLHFFSDENANGCSIM